MRKMQKNKESELRMRYEQLLAKIDSILIIPGFHYHLNFFESEIYYTNLRKRIEYHFKRKELHFLNECYHELTSSGVEMK